MKKVIEFLIAGVFAILLTGCDKGLSGTYKYEESGKTIEFTSSTDFKMHYPNGAVIDGTYKKTKAGYEFSVTGGSVLAVAKKEGKTLQMDDNLYVKQKENHKYHYLYMVLVILYYVGGFSLIICFVGNHKWMGFKLTYLFTSPNDYDSKLFKKIFLFTFIFWPFWIIAIILYFLVGD